MSDRLQRLSNILHRKLYILEDEQNPRSSKVDQVLPVAVIDDIFDDETASKSLREILEELHQEILTGGLGNIVFPVTSVNGKTDDVILTKVEIGLGRVDNTADMDKPLSTPQREAIMGILSDYDFHVNFQELYDHITNMNNPHGVTIDQLDLNGDLEEFVKRLIAIHNLSTEHTVHIDIRRSLATLWELVETINNTIDERVTNNLDGLNDHINDELAHADIFALKEDLKNKVKSFTDTLNNDHTKYPSTRAIVEYVANKLVEFNDKLPDVENWIDNIKVVDNESKLPNPPTIKYYRQAYFIRHGKDSHSEVAICRLNSDQTTFYWDISTMGAYTKFDQKYFMDTIDGMSLNMIEIVNALLSDDGAFKEVLTTIFDGYYNKEDIDKAHYISDINIVPGQELGTIRFYINDNINTLSEDVRVHGLERLAFLEWITENELNENAVHSRHIINKAIETRHIQDMAVTPQKIRCQHGYLIGNTLNPTNPEAHEITLVQLADLIRPLIGGYPDPNVPGGNPYFDSLYDLVPHPHTYTPDTEYALGDHSYIRRFTGTINQIPNMDTRTLLNHDITSKDYTIRDCGGTWVYQSDPKEMTILGGSNITGHTYAMILLTEEGLFLETISIGHRMDAPFDVWVKYTKNSEDGTYDDK